jgi:small subunit ribosomal protein S9
MFAVRRAFQSALAGSPLASRSMPVLGSYFRPLGQSFGFATDSYDDDGDSDDEEAVEQAPLSRGELPKIREREIDAKGRAYATGRRKTSVARVWIKEGCGQITVNDKNFCDFFTTTPREHVLEAFVISKTSGFFDVMCTAKGGGPMGQAGAVRLGIAKALEAYDPMLRPLLRSNGLLTRDSRRVERKKPGQKKARKKFQWVKR